jgi:hypothetical protein
MLQQPRRKTGTAETPVYTESHQVVVKMLARSKRLERTQKCLKASLMLETATSYVSKHMNRLIDFHFRQTVGTVCCYWCIAHDKQANMKTMAELHHSHWKKNCTTAFTCISKMEGLEAYSICKGSKNLQPFVPEREHRWVTKSKSKQVLEATAIHLG